ncbi:MAG: 50S ribosomal protein L21 [Bacillota bacterium]|jgi:large subunit ribosomal protein L21|nr:50S ribosomal protein L21 [Bacillota bacterium]MDD3297846.1 50S ribosomal protein L21 [Bacillota bacterium]MDD3851052.1 50S ribosomal protein L21 [Bacillota bacterium]MDD4706969.1 50S ribosomal protein L21 [Bacillota bacterium]
MYALIETGGKQYRIQEGDILSVEKLSIGEGEKVSFDKVLLLRGEDGTKVGKPYVEGAAVEGEVLFHGKGRKIIVFKYKAKKNYKKKQGHRQPFTRVRITKING